MKNGTGGTLWIEMVAERAYGGGWTFSSGWRYPQGHHVNKAGKLDKINNHNKSDHDVEVILKIKWGLERHCDIIFWLLSRLVWEVSKTNHVWNLFMLLYEKEQFLIVLLYLHVTFSIRNSSDLFHSIQFLVINVLGTVLLLYPLVLRPALLKKI